MLDTPNIRCPEISLAGTHEALSQISSLKSISRTTKSITPTSVKNHLA